MKVIRGLSLDSDVVEMAGKEIPNLSGWVNEKLKEYLSNQGRIANVAMPLYPDEVDAILRQRSNKLQAEQQGRADEAEAAEQKLQRIRWINSRLNELTEEKRTLKPMDGIIDEIFMKQWNAIRDEQTALHKELGELSAA